jgi:hypothetical protein
MQRRQSANVAKIARRATHRERIVAAAISLSVAVWFGGLWGLQKAQFDFGRVLNPCGFKQRTGYPCPACGMTTSVLAFTRGEVLTAFYVQPAAALVCALLVAMAFLALPAALGGVYFKALDRVLNEVKIAYLAVGLLVILAAGWAVTLARAFVARASG